MESSRGQIFLLLTSVIKSCFLCKRTSYNRLTKNHKIVVLHHYHENSDKIFLRYCQYVDEEAKHYRDILRKWYVY